MYGLHRFSPPETRLLILQGTKFFYPNGTQFYVQGVAYQPAIGNGTNQDSTGGFVDPLGDTAGCERDIPYLQALNVNLIRTYAIDTTLDHSGCIEAFGNAGTTPSVIWIVLALLTNTYRHLYHL